ncbi:MAG: hypothetical protein JXR96_25220 [Deltaproteobacteria bacterium]|nr:hypothetical protein [Deltaproteobacteria bacterium]
MDRHKRVSDYTAPGPKLRAGGEIDAWCTRCKLMLTHVILAMQAGEPVRVMCKTCKSQHRYRAGPPGSPTGHSPRKRSATWAEAPEPRPHKAWQEAVRDKNLSNPIPYSPKSTFETGQVLMHGKFGTGIVMGVKPGGKIIVVFEDDTRLLVHAR